MTSAPGGVAAERLDDLERLRAHARESTEAFLAEHGETVEAYRGDVTRAVDGALDRLRRDLEELTGHNRTCRELVDQSKEYVSWLQWTLWDLPYLAVAMRPPRARFRDDVAACGLVYLAIRIVDDVVDRHFWYKAQRPTLLTIFDESRLGDRNAEGLSLLAGLLFSLDGMFRLADSGEARHGPMLRRLVASYRRAVIGAIMEFSDREQWDLDYYERLVELKNVDFWNCQYAALDPERSSCLYPFLVRYYALAQRLNDVRDLAEDEQRGQPNFISIHRRTGGGAPRPKAVGSPAPPEVENLLADDFLELARLAEDLPDLEGSIARLKLGESLDAAVRLGLFRPLAEVAGAEPPAVPEALGLAPYAELRDVLERLGPEALEHVDCEVCGSPARKRVCEKRGFSLCRCGECSHLYVSPRLAPEVRVRMLRELGETEADDPFLAAQRLHAEPICQLLHARAPGPRLLDFGFGHGHLMRVARAYGFEVYGLDGSGSNVDRLRAEFGARLATATAGLDELPWDAFDVIVMSHVLEHLPDPRGVLAEIAGKLNDGGLIYVSVPDMGSLQFRIFGKAWEPVEPIAHLQYFTEESLTRLLAASGFEGLERVRRMLPPEELVPRWVRLMRRLGGEEAGELAMLARRPEGGVAEPPAEAPP